MNRKTLQYLWDNLYKSLYILSLPAEAQITYLNKLEYAHVDELALDFSEYWSALKPHISSDFHATFYEVTSCLDAQLNEISGKEDEALWSEDGLKLREEWSEVRRLASICLHEFQELVNKNNQNDDPLIALEKYFSKADKGEEYWKVRQESKKEADRLMTTLILVFAIIMGCFYCFAGLNRLSINSKWIETDALITRVLIIEEWGIKRQKAYVYEMQYSVRGLNFQGSRGMLGQPDYKENETIKVLVDPKNFRNVIISESDFSLYMLMSLGFLVSVGSAYFLFKRNSN